MYAFNAKITICFSLTKRKFAGVTVFELVFLKKKQIVILALKARILTCKNAFFKSILFESVFLVGSARCHKDVFIATNEVNTKTGGIL
jgi:hypothetical protein